MTQSPELHADEVSSPHVDPAPVNAGIGYLTDAPARRRPGLLVDRHRVFLALIGACVVAWLLAELPYVILQDTWLALVDGRQIATHGIPHHVVLTVFGQGHAWIDQQWLAQLWMYGLHQLGGLGLLGVANVALIAAGLAGGVAASVRLGASPRSVLPVFLLSALIVALGAEVRTQDYAYPLFVLTVYLLAADSRRPTRRVYWCLPVLVLWGNLHGSAALGAGLVALRGLTAVWERRREDPRRWVGPLGLIVGAPLALLLTPYGIAIGSYYRETLFSPAFRAFVTEWQPVTVNAPLAVLYFLLAGVTLWSLGRHGGRTTLWERAATLILAAGAIVAVRNVVWFALAMLILVPVWIDQAVRARERPAPARPRLNGSLLAAAGALVVVFLIRSFTAGTVALTPGYPDGALTAVRLAVNSHPRARVFADEVYADWLLWELPGVRGRVAYDAAFELLTRRQLEAIADLKTVTGLDWLRAADGDAVLVLADDGDPNPVHAVRVQTRARLLYDHDGVAVLER